MGQLWFFMLATMLPTVGAYLKSRDSNTTGSDDTVGDILIAAAPALEGLQAGDDSKVRKALTVVRTIIDRYLAAKV